ncbi:uncharacterized protein LOC123534965 [Mercenaria mercenaria]|uniref:uncharacterized protein LOC123534965 n=1 Tax=Mercenaria mercenaria TaxID=6596 RepID=UPI00234EEEEE|nr:uncharacterized protein LOC123534965 [Mercenaria mercenaria]
MDQTESLPVLYIRARSHYDVGFSIGTTFKGWIQDYIDTSNEFKQYRTFYNGKEGQRIVDQYMSTARTSHSNIMSEIQGMADGAEVKFEELFLVQISSELKFCHLEEMFRRTDEKENGEKGCTDVLVNRKQCRIIGHNDDWTEDVSSCVCIVHVTIADEKERVIEQFVSFNHPAYLNGFCCGMNKSLVISLNSLLPKKANRTGVPLAILLRSLLACNTIEECSSAMESKPYGCAYGQGINIAAINGTDMCSMEVYPLQGKTEVKVRNVPLEGDADEQCYFFHQNHYKHIAAEETGPCTGSKLRDKRTSEMPEPETVDDVKAILGDTEDGVEPVYRMPCAAHYAPDVKTVATAIFSITENLLHVYRANPKLASAPCLTLPFL